MCTISFCLGGLFVGAVVGTVYLLAHKEYMAAWMVAAAYAAVFILSCFILFKK